MLYIIYPIAGEYDGPHRFLIGGWRKAGKFTLTWWGKIKYLKNLFFFFEIK